MLDRERGDTLIEVIFATAVLALIIVISISIMNSGMAQSERAVEGTFVRQEIDSQTEMLHYLRDSAIDKTLSGSPTAWDQVKDLRNPSVPSFDTLSESPDCKPTNNKAFYLKTEGNTVSVVSGTESFQTPITYAHAGQGVWIEATPNDGSNYIDFYIYACWSGTSGTTNSTSGTIVRLYVP